MPYEEINLSEKSVSTAFSSKQSTFALLKVIFKFINVRFILTPSKHNNSNCHPSFHLDYLSPIELSISNNKNTNTQNCIPTTNTLKYIMLPPAPLLNRMNLVAT